MKKLIAIVLLIIHLFNIGGQLAFYQYLVYKSDKLFNAQINKNHYNIEDLTEIKIPVSMPGITDWKSYEKLSGQVKFADASYNYVRMRLTRNAIYLMCIPNYETTHLFDHNIIYAGQIKDIPVPKKEHVPFGKINLTAYNHQTIHYKFSIPIIVVRVRVDGNHLNIPNFLIAGPGQPPDKNLAFS